MCWPLLCIGSCLPIGHANIATTQRIYVHAYDAARRSEQRRSRLAAMYASDDTPAAEVVAALPARPDT
jgi:hypothetical protein